MFSLAQQTAILKNWNARAELNGEKRVPASDMIIGFAAPSTVLVEFDPALRSALYREPHPGEQDLADQAEGNELEPTRLRFPKMRNSIKWEAQIVGAIVTVHYGTGGPSDIVLGECKVDSFVFDPQDGGTVNVGLRIQCHPSQEQAGKLYELNGQEITISIAPPEADQGSLGV